MTRRLIYFLASLLLSWGLVSYPVFSFWGWEGILHSLLAMALCLVPGLLTLAAGLWIGRSGVYSDHVFLAAFGGTAFRMIVILGAVVFLSFVWADVQAVSFLASLAFFYIVSLALEVTILLTSLPLPSAQKSERL